MEGGKQCLNMSHFVPFVLKLLTITPDECVDGKGIHLSKSGD